MSQREERVEELLDEKSHADLVELTDKARDPLVHSIREQWKARAWISDKQARVLAKWIAEEEDEFGGDDEGR